MIDKRYSTSSGSSYTKHIYDHKTRRNLCGGAGGFRGKLKIQKTKYDAEGIIKKHHKHALDRGCPNNYKYICFSCLKKLDKNIDETAKKIFELSRKKHEVHLRKIGIRADFMKTKHKEYEERGWEYIVTRWPSQEKNHWLLPNGKKIYIDLWEGMF
jgi:hypothetical protein